PAGAMRTALLRLLQADQVAGVLDAPVEECAARIGEADRDAAIGSLGRTGQRIGPFRLLRMLGEGGMAVVYLAERDDPHFHQQVAIKLLRRGLYSEAD